MRYTGFREGIDITTGVEVGEKIHEGDIVSIYPFSDEEFEVIWDEEQNQWMLLGYDLLSFFDSYGNRRLLNMV